MGLITWFQFQMWPLYGTESKLGSRTLSFSGLAVGRSEEVAHLMLFRLVIVSRCSSCCTF